MTSRRPENARSKSVCGAFANQRAFPAALSQALRYSPSGRCAGAFRLPAKTPTPADLSTHRLLQLQAVLAQENGRRRAVMQADPVFPGGKIRRYGNNQLALTGLRR